MSSYSFSDAAVQNLNEIGNYIARNNPDAASKLFDAIRKKCVVVDESRLRFIFCATIIYNKPYLL